LSSLVDGRDLLDIGAGIGTFAKVASENGWRVICTDNNLKARDFGAQIYGLAYKNLEDIQSETMDVIRLSHVLEHILEPCPFLSEVRRTLKPGGVCQIIVPHYEPLNCLIKNLILRLIPGKHLFRGQLYAPQHVLGFTPFSLKNTLELAGFDTVRIHCVSRGNKTYYPWMSDDIKLSVKVIADELVNTVGNLCGRGSCIAGYFRK
jgi:SAM-dependent methyltransferase